MPPPNPLFVAAPNWCEMDEADDLQSIQGEWKLVSFELNGESAPQEEITTGKLQVAKDAYTATQAGRRVTFSIVLNAEKDPRTIDFTAREGPDKGRQFKGIYKLEGETLTVCRAVDEAGVRPTEFSTGAESGQAMLVWRRTRP